MIYKGKELNTIGEIFNEALRIAKEEPDDTINFKKSYADYIRQCNLNIDIETAMHCVEENLGYFAGYYSQETSDIIRNAYNAEHPLHIR